MTEQELIERVADINAQRAALKEERNRLAWTEGVPAIIAKMKSMGKDTLCLRDGEGFFDYTVSLWGYFEYGRGAAKKLYLDENDNLILIYNDLMNHENPSDSYWEYGDEDNEVIVNEEISNEIIAPNIDTLLNTKFYERYGLPFNSSEITDMKRLFEYCYDTILDVSGLDTSKVINMHSMFTHCANVCNLDLSNFNTSNVTDMRFMFSFCTQLQTIDLSNFDVSNVSQMNKMFIGCHSLKTVIMRNCSDETVEKIKAQLPEGVEIIR